MEWHKMLIQLLVFSTTLALMTGRPVSAQAKNGCQEKCGNLSIPYPFGTREGCYRSESHFIKCDNSTTLYLGNTPIEVLDISLEGSIRVLSQVAYQCYDKQVSCATSAKILGYGKRGFRLGCMSLCDSIEDVINGSCSGIGCCQTSIPKGLMFMSINLDDDNDHTTVYNFSKCSYGFVVEQDKYKFSSNDLANLRDKWFPVALDWAIGNEKCVEAQKNKTTFDCHENSLCYDVENGSGYRCNCTDGYRGNPYLPHGCIDINECEDSILNECTHNCNNTVGCYTCSCPKGYKGDGRKSGQGCVSEEDHSLRTKAIVGMSSSIALVLVINIFVYWAGKKRRVIKHRENFFNKNGGILLEKLLSENKDSAQIARIFSEEELITATNNFNESNVVGQGGYGTVYKGTLANNITVAIKKSKVIDRGQITQFVNEMIILSQIDHPNVVKLLGCCLETPVPLLVYEFITNKTLFHHLHDQGHHAPSIPWKLRLKIATQTADALAHMHSTTQIIHRDVKSANILLDDEFTAKVSDFGISRFIPLDKTHLSTLVQGTIGYIDPQYFRSGLLTEKSDVYSFGVILVELLTGEKVLSLDRPDWDMGLAMYFISSVEKNQLLQVLEEQVKKEGQSEQLKGVVELAKSCLELKGENRPTMMEVNEVLEVLSKF